MFKKFKPTWMVEAIYQIQPEQLKKLGFKAVLADLDNTLIAWNNPDGTEELIQWIKWMKQADIPVIILSNNSDKRIKRVADSLNLRYIPRALKPTTLGFKEAIKKLKLDKNEIVMVGDQVITDVFGANRAGIKSVLVRPIIDSDAWNTKINRYFELRIMRLLKKHDPEMKWRSGIHDENIIE
ncbi:MAG: YqeG family HAD IIIA-type phosphatase [Pisciglobus halotolerans]|nr:YqeG family HAD IIIA-type phosphatase [Pisciglobus halotolerans]